ncbi:penicillin-binding protein, partial [Bacillus thuringiensis]|nr:penicillin-binding protein [Bacillus thuringiensis]
LLAIKIGQTESKSEILGRYLNTIYFGRGSYGIQAAAQSYFGVDAKDLTVSQAAMLAGIIPSPSNWDPAVSPDKAQARWT